MVGYGTGGISDLARGAYYPSNRFSKSFGFDRAVYPEAYKKIERAWLD